MEKDLGNYRKNYGKHGLSIKGVPENPMELFQQWFHDAENSDTDSESNIMTLATVDPDGIPTSRIVLLKRFTWEGFIFYTNYLSKKGLSIEKNDRVCLSFFWAGLERQTIINGTAEKIAPNLSDGYFESRPEGSKLGAWASDQSKPVPSRAYLDNRIKEFEDKFKGKEIERPSHWGGYIVKPNRLEFWQGRPNRMHDRIVYSLMEDFDWKIERLAP